MLSMLIYSSTLEALNGLKTTLETYPSKLDIIQIYVKINAPFDASINESTFSYHLSCTRPVIIAFEFNSKSGKIFWRLSENKFYILEVHDDVGGIVTAFCAKFIAGQMQLNKLGKSDDFLRFDIVQGTLDISKL